MKYRSLTYIHNFRSMFVHTVIRPDIVGTYQYWAPKYESRPTDRNSQYIWIPNFRFCQKLKLVFRSLQTLALSKFTTGSGNLTLLVFCNRQVYVSIEKCKKEPAFFSDIWLVVRIVFVLTKSMSMYSKDPKANQQGNAKWVLRRVQYRFY